MKKYTTVTEFLADLDQDRKAQVEALRLLILKAGPNVEEHIKWNSPSYIFNGEDRITFNLQNKENVVKLILHMGALRKENKKGKPILQGETGLIMWSSDIRGILTFKDLEDIKNKRDSIAQLIREWLAVSS